MVTISWLKRNNHTKHIYLPSTTDCSISFPPINSYIKILIEDKNRKCISTIPPYDATFLLKYFLLLLLCWVGVHCSIYKGSYNVSNTSHLNSPPPLLFSFPLRLHFCMANILVSPVVSLYLDVHRSGRFLTWHPCASVS
jgi:hypothetical protein